MGERFHSRNRTHTGMKTLQSEKGKRFTLTIGNDWRIKNKVVFTRIGRFLSQLLVRLGKEKKNENDQDTFFLSEVAEFR